MKTITYVAISAVLGVSMFVGAASAQTASPSYPVYSPQGYCPPLSYNLYYGLGDRQTAGQVSQLQYFLGTYFAAEPVPVTGYFGPITQGFVARFQQANAVYPVTGGVGPLTRAAIARVCGGTVYPPPYNQAPSISYISPSSGPAGTSVTIYGTGFSQSNVVHFGIGGRMQVPSYNNGTQISFTIPSAVGNCDIVQTFAPCSMLAQQVTPGSYQMYVNNGYADSNVQMFTVTSGTGCYNYPWWYPSSNTCQQSSVSVTSPIAGQTFTHSGQMTITWSGSSSQNASTILDLYTSQGAKVGTVAVQSGTSGSFVWTLPPFPMNQYCTLQYPNPNCLSIPDGQYYIKATLVSGNGFDNGAELASSQSGTFTIGTSGCGNSCTSASLSASPTSGRAPLSVSFSATSLNSAYSYYVDFGDGTSGQLASFATSASVSHSYTSAGTYTAKLYQNNCPTNAYCFAGPMVVATVTITVDSAAQGNVTAFPSSGYAPLTVTFTVNSNSAQYFSVSFGDGTSATLQQGSVVHTYYSRGTFTAQFSTDYPCLHGQNGICRIATQLIGNATVTVY